MRPLGLSDADQTALLVAVGEACTNAVEHAGTSARAFFRVEAVVDDRDVLVSITDNGAWKDNPDRTARGNGLAIMRELMDDVRVEPRSSGTAVTLRLRSRSLDERVVLA
jgi:anti-sigma regulatory factor (Ser/Thr protein kinase)